jgi:hypothetical protein
MGRKKGSMQTTQSKLKISQTLKKAYRTGSRVYKSPMLGKKHTPATIEKMKKTAQARVAKGIAVPSHKGHYKKNAGYCALHIWFRRNTDKPMLCENCGSDKFIDIANKTGEYKRELDDWLILCRSCHMKYDRRNNVWKDKRFV